MKAKAQTLIEYMVLFGCMIIALVGMQIYLKRGISGGIKASADSLGRQFDPDHTEYGVSGPPLITRNRGESVTEVVTRKETDDDGQERFFTDTYTVTGPSSEAVTDDAGNVIIPADTGRRPDETTTTGREIVHPDPNRRFFHEH